MKKARISETQDAGKYLNKILLIKKVFLTKKPGVF